MIRFSHQLKVTTLTNLLVIRLYRPMHPASNYFCYKSYNKVLLHSTTMAILTTKKFGASLLVWIFFLKIFIDSTYALKCSIPRKGRREMRRRIWDGSCLVDEGRRAAQTSLGHRLQFYPHLTWLEWVAWRKTENDAMGGLRLLCPATKYDAPLVACNRVVINQKHCMLHCLCRQAHTIQVHVYVTWQTNLNGKYSQTIENKCDWHRWTPRKFLKYGGLTSKDKRLNSTWLHKKGNTKTGHLHISLQLGALGVDIQQMNITIFTSTNSWTDLPFSDFTCFPHDFEYN